MRSSLSLGSAGAGNLRALGARFKIWLKICKIASDGRKKERKKENGRSNNLFHHPTKRERSQFTGCSLPIKKIFPAQINKTLTYDLTEPGGHQAFVGVENDIHTAARFVAQDRIGQKKETVECRSLIIVSLPAQFEEVEINPAPDDAAHYRKTVPPR